MTGLLALPTTGTVSGLQENIDINNALAALSTMIQSGTGPTPASTGFTSTAGVWWHDTTNNQIKVRDQADTTWIVVGTIDETNKLFTAAGAFSTGDCKSSFKNVADAGWIILNDGTIGNSLSGATTRAAADCSALFQLLWNNVSNTNCPVSGGRGISAIADFNAGKTLRIPLALGRAICSAGAGSGLTLRNLGDSFGEESHALTVPEGPNHAHGFTGSPGSVDIPNTNNNDGIGSVGGPAITNGSGSATVIPNGGASVGSLALTSSGSGTAHNTMQPSFFVTVMMKL